MKGNYLRISSLGCIGLVALLCLLLCALSPGSTEADSGPVNSEGAGGPAVPSATISWVVTRTIETYPALGRMSIYSTNLLEGPLSSATSPYTFTLSSYDPLYLSDLTIDAMGGGTCTSQPNNDIVCTGVVTQLTVSFRYSLKPITSGSFVYYTPSSWSASPANFRLEVYYPAYLTFVRSAIQPGVVEAGHLGWLEPNMTQFQTQITFADARVRTGFVPMISR